MKGTPIHKEFITKKDALSMIWGKHINHLRNLHLMMRVIMGDSGIKEEENSLKINQMKVLVKFNSKLSCN